MYATLATFQLGPGMRSAGEKAADQAASLLKTLKGFKNATFFGDVEIGEYMTLAIWDTKEDAEAAQAVIAPKTQEAIGSILKAPPTRKHFEVYEPKS